MHYGNVLILIYTNIFFASADVGFAIWDRYTHNYHLPPVAYIAHLMGALARLTIGLLVLKNKNFIFKFYGR